MTDIKNLADRVLDEIKASEEYLHYKELLEEVKKDPELFRAVNQIREKNFMIQQSDSEDILDMVDALTNELEDVINNELATDFLEAEAVLCQMIQLFTSTVVDGLEFD